MLDGEQFFQHYAPGFVRAKATQHTTVQLYYAKLNADQHREHLRTSDWTPMIITFLDWLAWELGYLQLYERHSPRGWGGKRDCIWVKAGVTDRMVVIEPENEPRYVLLSEVPKLLTDEAPLKILITYHGYGRNEDPGEWRRSFLERLRVGISESKYEARPEGDIEFVTILGDRVEEDPTDWRGYSLRRKGRKWQDSWVRL